MSYIGSKLWDDMLIYLKQKVHLSMTLRNIISRNESTLFKKFILSSFFIFLLTYDYKYLFIKRGPMCK